jgi:hypothetical protein
MKRPLLACALGVSVLTVACTTRPGPAPNQATRIASPFPGTVLTARARERTCETRRCWVEYRVRITNPTDIDANVQTCTVEATQMRLPIMGIAGFEMPGGATKTVSAKFELPIEQRAIHGLIGADLTCTGLDWHGNPPI